MHDPSTLAFVIRGIPLNRRSWRRFWNDGNPTWNRLPAALDIWHDDPHGDRGRPCGPAKHWRWHIHHMRVRGWPWERIARRLQRCAECNRRMNGAPRHGYMSSDKVLHSECMNLTLLRSQKRQLLEMVDRVFDMLGIEDSDQLKALVQARDIEQDVFPLYYQTWAALEGYRLSPADEKWRAANQHAIDARRARAEGADDDD